MLDESQINQVKRLLADGWSDRKISVRLGVTRHSIRRIREKRPDMRKASIKRYQDMFRPRSPETIRREAKEALEKTLYGIRAEQRRRRLEAQDVNGVLP